MKNKIKDKALDNIHFEFIKISQHLIDLWNDEIHDDNADAYDCKLCGATIFPCYDYTHNETCELVKAEKAIDAALDAFEALDKALTQEGDKK